MTCQSYAVSDAKSLQERALKERERVRSRVGEQVWEILEAAPSESERLRIISELLPDEAVKKKESLVSLADDIAQIETVTAQSKAEREAEVLADVLLAGRKTKARSSNPILRFIREVLHSEISWLNSAVKKYFWYSILVAFGIKTALYTYYNSDIVILLASVVGFLVLSLVSLWIKPAYDALWRWVGVQSSSSIALVLGYCLFAFACLELQYRVPVYVFEDAHVFWVGDRSGNIERDMSVGLDFQRTNPANRVSPFGSNSILIENSRENLKVKLFGERCYVQAALEVFPSQNLTSLKAEVVTNSHQAFLKNLQAEVVAWADFLPSGEKNGSVFPSNDELQKLKDILERTNPEFHLWRAKVIGDLNFVQTEQKVVLK